MRSQVEESWKLHGGDWRAIGFGDEAAAAGELPQEKGDGAQGGNVSAATSLELLPNQPSLDSVEELATSLMESLDMAQLCRDLLGKLKESVNCNAATPCKDVRQEYVVCLQCRQCLTCCCLYCSEAAADQHLPTLATILHSVDLLVHEEEVQVEVGLCFELALGGELFHGWEVTQRFPEIPPERCCQECGAPLPKSPGHGESSWPAVPNPSAQGTAKGPEGGADLQPAGPGVPLPTAVPTWPLPPWAQPPSPEALDQLQNAGMEPLPSVGYRAGEQGLSLKCFRRCCAKLKDKLQRCVATECCCLMVEGSVAPSGAAEEDQTLPLESLFTADTLCHHTGIEA
ncbi:uncharacterized protein LOC122154491 isoform X1 [Tyto alba]|uniref:uncharacterized protein LOC122154491 isoform X1 n=1 Tax=Tyto alba TaxID=56313 RepID=UPI001C670688|nr:uncharacterized protein LOC122154491 isoform X1 [Tyto alba]XP_042658983.1 uncharacterized protein LOC122154491 isoform X1 [Tyto alba]XP_042658984.1 uncharacterized protein LOC122154491 isoform X1 [Tyto alba]